MRPGPARPRMRLGTWPTPVVAAHRAAAELGCPEFHVKRDDLAGFGVAGNKTRPLEYLLGDAVARGRDLLVTGGGPDSNFVAGAALAARIAGMDCELVVWGDAGTGAPNLALARAAGARIHPLGDHRRELVDSAVADLVATRERDGRRPVGLPRGGSTPLGAVGFAEAAVELAGQVRRAELPAPALVVLPVGSGGSAAGLLAGLAAVAPGTRVLGASVSRPPEAVAERVRDLARCCAELLGTPVPAPDACEIVDARGPGFGIGSAEDHEAADLALRTEGLLLDDTYGAKAFAVAVRRLRAGDGAPLLFWHTGGVVSAIAHARPGPGEEDT